MSSTHSISSGTLNPEAHEFKFKLLFEKPSRSNEESSQNNSENSKKCKGKYNLKNKLKNGSLISL